jgi:hypothetical protein
LRDLDVDSAIELARRAVAQADVTIPFDTETSR